MHLAPITVTAPMTRRSAWARGTHPTVEAAVFNDAVGISKRKKTRGKPRVFTLGKRLFYCNYQLSFSVYLPLVEPVPPL